MSVNKRTRVDSRGKETTRWRVFWLVDGVQHNESFTTEREAKQRDRQVHLDLARGSYTDRNDPTTLGEYAREYLGNRSHSPSSRKVYLGYLRRIEASGLGSRPLGKVRPSEITGFVSRQRDELADRTVTLMVSFLRSIYAAAVADERCIKSPVPRAQDLRLPAGDTPDIVVPEVAEVDELADAMERLEPRARALVSAQAGLGLRIGEVFALRKQDLDFGRREVTVCGRVLVGPVGKGPRVRVPGCKGSTRRRLKTRVVPLLPDVAKELAAHMLAYPPRADGALFTDAAGELWSHSAYEWRFGKAREQAGLSPKITTHTLRHHFASVALAKGVPLKDVATFLGHTNTRLVERIYGHVMGDAGARFIESMGKTWGQGDRRARPGADLPDGDIARHVAHHAL